MGWIPGLLLDEFFAAVEEQAPGDKRFEDAAYLAARFVAFLGNKYSMGGVVNFRSVGIVPKGGVDCDFEYTVNCRDYERPKVTWR